MNLLRLLRPARGVALVVQAAPPPPEPAKPSATDGWAGRLRYDHSAAAKTARRKASEARLAAARGRRAARGAAKRDPRQGHGRPRR